MIESEKIGESGGVCSTTVASGQCAGCGVCAVVCPQGCLSMCMSDEGFYVPLQKKDTICNRCNVCRAVCPTLSRPNAGKIIGSYACFSRDEETRQTCSSGGVAFEIAKAMVANGRKVCGVVYDPTTGTAEHVIIEGEERLERIKGSKYIQSRSAQAFSRLFDGDRYVVFGTPCQIAAISKAATMRKVRGNLILVDFFCHGVPSYLLWEKYLQQAKLGSIKMVYFRDKHMGWHSFLLRFDCDDGIRYSKSRNDLFYKFFLGNYCLNAACYACSYRISTSAADIRLGDLWSTEYQEDVKGVSGVLALSPDGVKVLSDISDACVLINERPEHVTDGQIHTAITPPLCRAATMKALRTSMRLKTIYISIILAHRLREKAQSVFSKLMPGVV